MSRRGWALFIALEIIWGTPYLLIKVAVEDLAPASLVLVRTSLATLMPPAVGGGPRSAAATAPTLAAAGRLHARRDLREQPTADVPPRDAELQRVAPLLRTRGVRP